MGFLGSMFGNQEQESDGNNVLNWFEDGKLVIGNADNPDHLAAWEADEDIIEGEVSDVSAELPDKSS